MAAKAGDHLTDEDKLHLERAWAVADKDREYSRQNFIDARNIADAIEERYFDNIRTGTNLALFSNSGALVALVGLLGAVGGNLVSIVPLVLAMVPFGMGLICGAVAILIVTSVFKADAKISVESFIEAVHESNLEHFHYTASGRDERLERLFWAWRLAGAFFLVGCISTAVALLFTRWEVASTSSGFPLLV